MNKLSLLTLAVAGVFGVGSLCAQSRTTAEMESIASHFFQSSIRRAPGHTGGIVATSMPAVTAVSAAVTYQVYAPAEGEGFVIVSTDRQQPAVLGFSETGEFSIDRMPPAMDAFLQGTAGNAEGTHLSTRAADEVEPLLGNIEYNQSTPFNNLCPVSNGQLTVTGCVATAMSEVMAYYRYPSAMTGDAISYTCRTNQISVDWTPSATVFDWDNMLPQYVQAETNPVEGETVGSDLQQFGCAELSAIEGYITATEVWNCLGSGDFTGTLQLLLTTADGEFICPVGTAKTIASLKQYSYYTTLNFVPGMPGTASDGDYRLYLGSKSEESTEWSIVRHTSVTNSQVYEDQPYLSVHKSGITYTIGDETYPTDYTPAQAEAVATLHAACGAAVSADYGVNETSASSQQMLVALYQNFGYDDGMAYVGARHYPSTEQVEAALIQEIQAGRPVLAGGTSASGGGHQYVVDGVKSLQETPYFHFNWGWGGYNNGWFLLNLDNEQASEDSALNGYCYDFDFLLGCKPDDNVESPFIFGGDALQVDADRYMPGNTLTVKLVNCYNKTARTFTGNLNVWLVPVEGDGETLLGTIGQISDLPACYGYNSLEKTFTLPATLSSGLYTIQLRTQAVDASVVGEVLFGAQPQFRIGEEENSIDVPINQTLGIATFYWDKPARIPEGVSAFTGTLSDDNTVFTLSQITANVIPANTGVILSAPGQQTLTMESADAVDAIPSDLTGSLVDVATSEVVGSGNTVWVISSQSDGSAFGFYRYVGETIPANRAYLVLPSAGNAPTVHIPFGAVVDDVTDMETLPIESQGAKALYDLQGRRVTGVARPGIYILDGRKVLKSISESSK